jgi:hypothetical protein
MCRRSRWPFAPTSTDAVTLKGWRHWQVPISDEQRAYKQEHGTDALIDRMEAVELPWVFDENNRPSLVG